MLALLVAFALARTPLPPPQPAAPTWSAWPASGTVTSPFGNDGGRQHAGIDIGILRSPVVRAAQRGHVIAVGEPRGLEGYGNVVEVALGNDFVALYAHLASWRVRVGDEVVPGEELGAAGCTGWCTGTHLHFELRRRGQPVDPLLFRAQKRGVRRSASFCLRSGGISSTAACRTNRRSSSSKR